MVATNGQLGTQHNRLEGIVTSCRRLPNRVLLYAPEKFGKTSFAAHAPKPVFLCTEDGLDKLIDGGRLPETPHFPDVFTDWKDLLGAVNQLVVKDHDFRTVVLDTLNGVEQLLFSHVTRTQCGDDADSFEAYGRGYVLASKEWPGFLDRLDSCRRRGMSILLLAHTKIQTFKNPAGDDYDRYQPDLHKTSWSVLHKWLDMILFGNFEATIKKANRTAAKGKASGGNRRIIYTERSAAFDAGNRHGLPAEIPLGQSPAEAWDAFITAVKGKPD